MNFSTLCTFFGDIQSRKHTFCGDSAKIGISRQISQNVLNLPLRLLYRFGSRIGGMIIPIFVWRSPKGRCYGNQLNLGDVCRYRQERPLLLSSAFDNGLAYRKSAFKSLNGNIRATSYPNMVNFRPIICEFTLLKRAIFVAIRQQFYDDLHSSGWRF